MSMPRATALERAPSIEIGGRGAWRRWLEANHATSSGIWLVTWRPSSGRPHLGYEDAIEEALCFGWIDGQAGTVDELRSKQYFAPRRSGSAWAATNKERVERLMSEGRVAPAGMATIERAKADGTWTVLDGPTRLEVPADVAAALAASSPAQENWNRFPPSARRAMLGWIATAKRSETRRGRIEKVVASAVRNERALG